MPPDALTHLDLQALAHPGTSLYDVFVTLQDTFGEHDTLIVTVAIHLLSAGYLTILSPSAWNDLREDW